MARDLEEFLKARIRKILFNKVGNAVKFTEQGGVTIDVRTGDFDGLKTQFIIAVKDTGVGISEEQAKKLFIYFHVFSDRFTKQ